MILSLDNLPASKSPGLGNKIKKRKMIDPCLAVYGVSSTSVVVLAASVLHAVTLWGFCLLFLLLDRFPSCRHHRLQRPKLEHLRPDSPKNVALDAVAFREQLLGTFVVVPLGVLLLTPVLAWRGNTICEDENSSTKTGLIMHVVGMVCGCDLIFYWTHRLLHENKWLYRNVHKQHHEYKATNVWASEYFGVVDMVLNILPGVIPAVVFGSSFRSLLWFTALRQFQTVQSHAGYNLPWCVCAGEGLAIAAFSFCRRSPVFLFFLFFFLFFLSQVSRPMQPVRRCETARLPPQPQHWLLRGLVSVLGSYLWNRSELPNVLGAKGTDGGKGKVVLKQQKRQQQKDKKAILVWILMISCSNSNRWVKSITSLPSYRLLMAQIFLNPRLSLGSELAIL